MILLNVGELLKCLKFMLKFSFPWDLKNEFRQVSTLLIVIELFFKST